MQQLLLKRKFFVLLDAVQTKNVHYIEEKTHTIKKIIIKKIQKNRFKY